MGGLYRVFKIVLALALLLLGADLALELLVPQDMLRETLRPRMEVLLGRQVRMGAVSLGLWKGLRVSGLAVSEAPDFSAGTFLETGEARLGWYPWRLLSGRIAISELRLEGMKLQLVRDRKGRFNFSDLYEHPASSAAVSGIGALAARAARRLVSVEVLSARVRGGQVLYADLADGFNVKARDLSLWADGLSVRGRAETRADFKLKGVYRDKPLEAWVSLEARGVLRDWHPVASAGRLAIEKLRHPNFKTEGMRAEWDLRGLTPDLLSAEGVIRLTGSPGVLYDPAGLSRQGRWVGLLLYPLEVLARFRGLGLPDLRQVPYAELRGDYSLKAGSVNIAPLYIRGPVVSINAEGVLSLRRRSVGLKANLILGNTAVGVLVKGPIEKPSVIPDLSFTGDKGTIKTLEQTLREMGKKPTHAEVEELRRSLEKAGDIVDGAFKPKSK